MEQMQRHHGFNQLGLDGGTGHERQQMQVAKCRQYALRCRDAVRRAGVTGTTPAIPSCPSSRLRRTTSSWRGSSGTPSSNTTSRPTLRGRMGTSSGSAGMSPSLKWCSPCSALPWARYCGSTCTWVTAVSLTVTRSTPPTACCSRTIVARASRAAASARLPWASAWLGAGATAPVAALPARGCTSPTSARTKPDRGA